MTGNTLRLRISLMLLLTMMVGVVPMFCASAVIGSVAGSANATLGGHELTPNTTLFSGDNLRVNNGVAVVAMGMGSRMVFGTDTVASFERGQDEVTVLLSQGNVSMYHPEDGTSLRVKIGEVSISATKGFKTLGDVAMVDGVIVVTAKEGMLRVQGPGRSTEVTKGNTIAITQKPAGSPQPQAGSSSSHWTQSQVIAAAALGVGAANVVLAIVNLNKIDNVQTQVTKTDADAAAATAAANQADKDAIAATAAANAAKAAANNAGLVASTACKAATNSPTNPACAFTPTP